VTAVFAAAAKIRTGSQKLARKCAWVVCFYLAVLA